MFQFAVLGIIYLLISCQLSFAQQTLSMDEAVAIAMTRHPVARNAVLEEQKDILMRLELAPTDVKYWQAHTNRLWSATQNFGSVPEHFRRAQHYRTVSSSHQAERALTLDELAWRVKVAYMDAVYCRQRLQIMQEYESYFDALMDVAEIRHAADSITELAMVSAGTRYAAYQSRMYIAEEELKRAQMHLCQMMNLPDVKIETSDSEMNLYQIHPEKDAGERFEPAKHKALDEAYLNEAQSLVKLEKSKLFPAVHAGYIHQRIEGLGNYRGWMAGLSVPLWALPQRARIKQAEIEVKQKNIETEYRQYTDMQHVETLKSLLNEYFVQISFCRENLLIEAQLMLEEVEKDFSAGRIANFAEAITKVNNALSAYLTHLEYMNLYNRTALELEYYTQ